MLKLRKMENNYFDFLFKILILNFLFSYFFFDFVKDLTSNVQVNPNIEKHQIFDNSAKNLLEKVRF